MKTLLAIFLVSISFFCNSQDFKTNLELYQTYPASYLGSGKDAVITEDGLFIHSRYVAEAIDLKTGKTVFSWDPDGSDGFTWIREDGKFIGNCSQNAKHPDGRWVDALHILDVTTKKVYTEYIPAGFWNKGSFSPNGKEVLVSAFDVETGGTSIIVFNFIEGKIVKKYFSTSDFSTIIMALKFSEDGSKIYAGIAENSTNSYLRVFDTKSGATLKKVKLTYQLDKIFLSDEYIFVSGVEGNSGKEHTSKISKKDYSKKAVWDFRIHNIDPTGTYTLLTEYTSDVLSKIDLSTGLKSDLVKISSIPGFGRMIGISTDSKYFYASIERKGELKNQGGSDAYVVFKNELIETETAEAVLEEIDLAEMDEEEIIWFTHNSNKPNFKIDFPSEPEIEDGTNKKGRFKQKLSHKTTNVVYMINLVEIAPKTKKSKYLGLAKNMGELFMEKMDPPESKTSEFSYDGQKGIEYTFTKGNVFYRYRSICLNGYAYQLIFLNSSGDNKVGDAFYTTFTTHL
jgi:DNA-binding beta-propeller fold protein YncE